MKKAAERAGASGIPGGGGNSIHLCPKLPILPPRNNKEQEEQKNVHFQYNWKTEISQTSNYLEVEKQTLNLSESKCETQEQFGGKCMEERGASGRCKADLKLP